ncbi:hypothetical protein TSOC_013466, partial [Tetrabaena socialis]
PVAVRAALQLLASPLPPLCQPTSTAAVEVKALACTAEAAFGAIKATAACWLGEHVNSIAGEYAWKQWEAKLGPGAGGLDGANGGLRSAGPSDAIVGSEAAALATSVSYRGGPSPVGTAGGATAGPAAAGGEEAVARLAVAGVAHNPLLALSVAHMHRAMLTGGWRGGGAGVAAGTGGAACVSVSAGDSVRVLHDLGEWFQVVAPSGQAGLVPASYVQLLDEQAQAGGEARGQRASQLAGVSSGALGGGALSSQPSFGGRAQASAGHVGLQPAYSYAGSQGQPGAPGGANAEYYAYQYENPEYDANNGNGAYGSYYGDYTQYGGDQYGGGSYTDAAYGGMYGEEAPAADAGGRGGKKGGFGGFDDFGAVLAEVKTAAAAARQQQQQEQRQQTATLLDAASTSTSTTLPAAPAPDADPEPPAAAPSYGDAAYGADNTWSAQGGAQEAATAAAEAGAGAGGGGRGSVVYDFTAEMDGELTVGAGEELELLGGEVDGWYTARVVSDGRQGLIPASYVQL